MTAPSEALLPFIAERIAKHRYPLGFHEPFAEWQTTLRSIWRDSLPPAGIARIDEVFVDATQRHLQFHYTTGDSGEAVLLLPNADGPYPAVLLMHDHGGVFDIGWQKIVASDAGRNHAEKHYHGNFLANDLVAQGYAVLVCDALGWGSRLAGGYSEQQALSAQALQAGWSLAGLVASDDLAAFDWLCGHPEIDRARVSTFGYSFGGFRAWQLAALDQRVCACVALSWAGTRAEMLQPNATLLKGQSAYYTLHPSIAGLADFPDMAALAADRPFFLRTGSEDKHFPEAGARAFLDKLRSAGPTDMMDAELFSGGHICPREIQVEAFAFLKKQLFA